jgi:predicted transglutaminase-like cysteine proteinase
MFHKRIVFLAMVILLGIVSPSYAVSSYFRDVDTIPDSDLKPFPKWTGMIDRYAYQQQLSDDQCDTVKFHPCSIMQWKELTEGLKNASLEEKLDKVNDWSNAHPYIIDQINWGMNDYWETPYEFMEINGDCEDYAISKYYSLRAAGVPAEKMRVIIVQDLNLGGIIHAILGVIDGDDLLILDNQIKQVRSAYKILHYKPIYSVNEDGWWRYVPNS